MVSEMKRAKSVRSDEADEKTTKKFGRKRDHTRDAKILEAAIEILAEAGFDHMTMDMVAAQAKAGKATMYRRWSSKAELVRDALTWWMNRNHLELESLPDTGSLRSDLLALLKPQSIEEETRKFRIIAGLGSFLQRPEFAEVGLAAIFAPWITQNRELMNRAADRGEISGHANIELACQVITSMASYRALIQHKTFNKLFLTTLIDDILLPALKNPLSSANGAE